MGAHRAGHRPAGSRRAGTRRRPRRRTGRLVIGGLAALTTAVSVLGGLGVGGINGAQWDLRGLTEAGSDGERSGHSAMAELAPRPAEPKAARKSVSGAIDTAAPAGASPAPTARAESGVGNRGQRAGADAADAKGTDDPDGPAPAQEVSTDETLAEAATSKATGRQAGPQSSAAAGALRHGPIVSAALPARSGLGRRVVFSESAQRVWIVEGKRNVRRSYLVSGSLLDNLQPGTYEVFSRSRYAVGIQDSGVMERFVRFTHGPSGAAIGFHTIPTKDGLPLQTKAQLGTPRSHGCIRQDAADALAMWEFAQLGTTVVVTA